MLAEERKDTWIYEVKNTKPLKNRFKTGSYTCRSLWTAGRRDSTVFGVVDDTTTTKFVNRTCAVHDISLPVVVHKVVVVVVLKFTSSTTTGSEIQCTAQARLANFVVVVSSTTPKTVQSRRPASQASAGRRFFAVFFAFFCLRKSRYPFHFLLTSDVD